MAELTIEQRDALLQQNAANLARQAAAAEALLAAWQEQAAQLLSPRGELYLTLYRFHFEQRKTALSTATTDVTLQDIVRDAVLLTDAAVLAMETKVLP
jgi:hypothetical protein